MSYASTPPTPIAPVYSTPVPNENIVLYTGQVELEQKGKRVSGLGEMKLEWQPLGGLNLGIDVQGVAALRLEAATAHLVDIPVSANIDVTGMHIQQKAKGSHTHITAVISDSVSFGKPSALRYIRFHLANFPAVLGATSTLSRQIGSMNERWERIELVDDDWKVTLDPIERVHEFEKNLKAVRGFGITWVGQLERKDGKLFHADQAQELFKALNYVVSFACGRSCPAMLFVGYDDTSTKCWELWDIHFPSKWRGISGWFDVHHATSLSRLFPGFLKRWRDADWREAIKDSIGWYISASRLEAGLDASIALAQMVLEMLTWLYFVEDSPIVSEGGFERLPAGDKIKLLLSSLSIPIDLRPELSDLLTFGRANNLQGPDCITETRNAIVHRNKKKRLKASKLTDKAIFETWTLSLWYIELVLLRVCEFRGDYSNRLKARFVGEVERVPWDI